MSTDPFKTVARVTVLIMVANLAFWGTVIAVALHFISKFW